MDRSQDKGKTIMMADEVSANAQLITMKIKAWNTHDETLKSMWNQLTPSLQQQFVSKYRNIMDMVGIKVNWNILRAIVWFWSPDYRCFIIGDNDLTPTIEEYCDMLGYGERNLKDVYCPDREANPARHLAELFKIKAKEAAEYVLIKRRVQKKRKGLEAAEDCPIDYYQGITIDQLQKLRDKKIQDSGDFSIAVNALALAIYGLVIFPSKENNIDPWVICFVAKLKESTNPIPAILAETIQSLNYCRRKGEGRLKCCCPMLQTWVCSHFLHPKMMNFRPVYDGFCRPLIDGSRAEVPNLTIEQWGQHFLSFEVVVWLPRWFGRKDTFLIGCSGFSWVPLIGPWSCINYAPILVMRQFEAKQVVPFLKGLQDIEENLWENGDWQVIELMKTAWRYPCYQEKGNVVRYMIPGDDYKEWRKNRVLNFQPRSDWNPPTKVIREKPPVKHWAELWARDALDTQKLQQQVQVLQVRNQGLELANQKFQEELVHADERKRALELENVELRKQVVRSQAEVGNVNHDVLRMKKRLDELYRENEMLTQKVVECSEMTELREEYERQVKALKESNVEMEIRVEDLERQRIALQERLVMIRNLKETNDVRAKICFDFVMGHVKGLLEKIEKACHQLSNGVECDAPNNIVKMSQMRGVMLRVRAMLEPYAAWRARFK